MNTISYYIHEGDALPSDWSIDKPLENIDIIDSSICQSTLNKLFIRVRSISWDVDEKLNKDKPTVVSEYSRSVDIPIKATEAATITTKEDLYIRPPTIPQFDITKPWLYQVIDNTPYVIYKSLPEIPVIQNQISVTTDINMMTSADLLKLYPNCYIKTRPAVMYDSNNGLKLDSNVGILIPIKGFSPKQVRDNIIKYPHWFKLSRVVDNQSVSFYQNIEIDGELHDTLKVWDTLPDSKKIPKTAEFIREYVVRRYLLERDIKNIKHKYPMYGDLGPFLILFTSPAEYKKLGYSNAVEYAKQCVSSRVAYKRSRNPIIRLTMEVK